MLEHLCVSSDLLIQKHTLFALPELVKVPKCVLFAVGQKLSFGVPPTLISWLSHCLSLTSNQLNYTDVQGTSTCAIKYLPCWVGNQVPQWLHMRHDLEKIARFPPVWRDMVVLVDIYFVWLEVELCGLFQRASQSLNRAQQMPSLFIEMSGRIKVQTKFL